MKLIPTLLFTLSVALTGCYSGESFRLDSPQKLEALSGRYLNMDLPSHNGNVDIFLPNESIPDSMILPVQLLEEWSYSKQYSEMIRLLKKDARERGLDGVILLDRQFVTKVVEGNSVTTQVATGVGFVYKTNLDRIEILAKSKYYEIKTDSGWVELAKADFVKSGQVLPALYYKPEYKAIMQKQVEPFDLTMLHSRGGAGWKATVKEQARRQRVQYVKRISSVTGSYSWVSESIDIDNQKSKGFMTVDHEFRIPADQLKGEKFDYRHHYTMNEAYGRITRGEITVQGEKALFIKQEYHVNDAEQVVGGTWYKLDKSGNEVPFVRTRIEYYQASDFIPSLKFAPDIPMRADRTGGRG